MILVEMRQLRDAGKKLTINFLQRHFILGYGRAAILLEKLQEEK